MLSITAMDDKSMCSVDFFGNGLCRIYIQDRSMHWSGIQDAKNGRGFIARRMRTPRFRITITQHSYPSRLP